MESSIPMDLRQRIDRLNKLAGKLESRRKHAKSANEVRKTAEKMRFLLDLADFSVHWLDVLVRRLDSYHVHDDIALVRRFNDVMRQYWQAK